MDASDSPVEVVRRFCASWADGDLDAIVGAFTDDAVYHNIPIDPVTGPEAIRTFIEGFLGGVDEVTFEVRDGRIAAWRDYFDLQTFMNGLSG